MSRARNWKQALLALAAALGWAQAVSAQPVNDNFANATFITGYSAQVTGSNAGAGSQSGEPSHAGIPGGHSVWWRWTAPASGNVAINTLGSSFDTVLAIYTGSQLGGLANTASNNNSGSSLTSAVAFNASRGEMYLIAVDGIGGATGDIVLNLTLTPALANDLFASATVITSATLQTSGNLSAAGAEPGEPAHGSDGPTQSVWWRWTAPADGPVMVRKSGASPTDLAVYTGSSLSTLQVVAEPDPDASSAINFNATAGTTYRMAIDASFPSTDAYFFWFYASVLTPAKGVSPANVTASVDGAASFRATTFGNPKPTSQWQRKPSGTSEWLSLADGPDITGATTPILRLTGLTASMSGDEFRCVFTNSGGSINSNVARLTVRSLAAPSIVGQPVSSITGIPGKVALSASEAGSPAASYQWQRAPLNSEDWTNYATTPTFALTLPTAMDFGYQYRAVANNSEGSAYSIAAIAAMRQSLAIFPLLESNTTLTIFGSLSFSELPPQTFLPNVEGVVALAAGRSHVVALKSDGTVIGWGDPYGGSIPVPADLEASGANVVSLSSWYGTYAMRVDGTARVWEGGNPNASTTGGTLETVMSQGYRLGIQINGVVFQSGTGPLFDQPSMSSSVTNAIAVAGGYVTAYALHGNGTVSGWGLIQGFNGTVPADLANVVALTVNDRNVIALKADGTVVQWGANVPPPPADLDQVVAVAAGYRHALALRRDGTVVAWGENPTLVSLSQSLDQVVTISAGSWNTAILQKNTWDVPVIVSHPRSRMLSGNAATLLYVGAVGPGNLTYQWYKDSLDNPIPEATSPAYQTPVLTSPTAYYVKVTNSFGAAVSAPATIIAGSPPASAGVLPTIVSQPVSHTVGYETVGSLTVDASPTGLAYQWFQGARGDTSTPVGANSANFTTPLLTENATYWVRLSNAAGSANSQAAQLTVLSPSATWAAALGLSGADLAPEATPFADGLPNLLRYALNLGATPSVGQLPGGSYETVDGVTYFKLQFRKRKNLAGAALATQFSTDLADWQTVPPANLTQLADDDADTERWEARLPVPPDGRIFLRLRATEN